MNLSTEEIHQANKKRWDASAKNWAENADSRGIWQKCHEDPSLVFSNELLFYLKGVGDKRVCVLGSGDNEAVFALTGLGADVTSVDISAEQLAYAKERSEKLGLEIEFLQSDVTDLSALKDGSFDVVFTGGHVAVWVADLASYYREAARILRPGGLLFIEEYHPIRRIWKESDSELVVGNSYYNRGPYKYMVDNNILYEKEGDLASFEFHWTISDMVNTVIQSNCEIVALDEYGESGESWEDAPMEGLPEQFLIVAKKR